MLEIIIGIVIGFCFLLLCVGGYLMHDDEQQRWDLKNDYKKMKKEIERNDSSRDI
jgi:hypothetical protein